MPNLLLMLRRASGIHRVAAVLRGPGSGKPARLAEGEGDEGLDVLAPQVVEGVLAVIRHPARGAFPAVAELQGRDAPRVRLP